MNGRAFGHALCLGAAATLPAACGGSQLPLRANISGTQSASRIDAALDGGGKTPGYRVLYRFGKPPDGADPVAALTNVRGTLYGTTSLGGLYSSFGTLGTVFSITPNGNEKVLYTFPGGSFHGANPVASLVDVKGTLYGTTELGGPNRMFGGTVFSITTSGKEKVLHFFGNPHDGMWPYAGLIDVNGTLYGTTNRGGTYSCPSYGGCGTVFSITQDGTERVLHSFGGKHDGAFPAAGLIDVDGTLYGTTSGGGKYAKTTEPNEGGVVFSITTSGEEKVLHSFGDGTDGAVPYAGLLDVNGTLYGTTRNGGAYYNSCGNDVACGTVFSITTAGRERVLHSFGYGYYDGCIPLAGLIHVQGTLYGTASRCGEFHETESGDGTIYSVTTGGTFKVLHSFGRGAHDGWRPEAGLIDVGGTLYGTTTNGGRTAYGNGTAFALTL